MVVARALGYAIEQVAVLAAAGALDFLGLLPKALFELIGRGDKTHDRLLSVCESQVLTASIRLQKGIKVGGSKVSSRQGLPSEQQASTHALDDSSPGLRPITLP